MKSDERVVIVGAGPVGLTLAWRLLRAGIEPVVLEADHAIADQLRASTFHPPTLDLLEADGITTRLLGEGRITPTWQVRVHETGERVEFDLGVLADDTGHPYRLQCHQRVLSQALAAELERAGVAVRFGTRVIGVDQDADSAWAILGDGERVAGRFLAGCEGARSIVRDAIGGAFEGAPYPEITVLATTRFAFERVMPDLSGVNYIWKANGAFSLLRLPDVWRCSFQARSGQDIASASDDQALRAHLEEILPEHAEDIAIEECRPYRVHRRLASNWYRGRLVIAGDAAHLNSPKGGMGLNGGVHDAFELATTLAAGFGAGGAGVRLDRYEARRRPVVAEDIIAQADASRARMAITDESARAAELARLQRIAADPLRAREFLRHSSMIAGLERARAIAD